MRQSRWSNIVTYNTAVCLCCLLSYGRSVFQEPFNSLTFHISGDDRAPVYFDVDAESGEVTLNRTLTSDDHPYYIVSRSQNCYYCRV